MNNNTIDYISNIQNYLTSINIDYSNYDDTHTYQMIQYYMNMMK
jgi:hypothetical protein